MREMAEQMSMFDLGLQFGKMFKEPSAQITEKTSELCWKNLSTLNNQTLQCLDARSGVKQDTFTEILGVLLGDFSMLNIGESPKEERESHLSWILQDKAPEKYYLSEKACQGILNRASKRGKELPEILKNALENVVHSKLGGGVSKDSNGRAAGKGALIQNDLSGTLGVSQDQTLFCNSSGGGVAGTLDASYYKGAGTRRGHEREFITDESP